MKLEIKVIRSGRKSISIQVDSRGQVTVRAPYRAPMADIEQFVEKKRAWIEKHVKAAQEEGADPPLTIADIHALGAEAMRVIPERVRYYAPLVGVTYGKVTIRNQRTLWGSCSAKGNLSFNCLLMLCPPEVIDSVVVHELCHRKEMNHSERFYAEVLRVFPEYRKWDRWLKKNGRSIRNRMES